MPTENDSILEEKTPFVSPGNYSPVNVTDTVGSVFLGILSVILLVGWMRAEARFRAVITQREQRNENRSLNTG